MAGALSSPRFHGLRLGLADDQAATPVFERLFGAPVASPVSPGERQRGSRFVFCDSWIEVRAPSGNTLDLRCEDLDAQRTHLQRLGIEALDGSLLGCTPSLRLDAMDTGACAVDLRENAPLPGRPEAGSTRLSGLELSVRAPERVALHWSQLFHARPCRDGDGVPSLRLAGFSLRFASAADGHTGVSALDFETTAFEALLRNASLQGFRVRSEAQCAAFAALGMAFRLRPRR